ncbi:MAG: hypothetical protein OEZ06_14960 [Myxococcales bacterium]|nr:hypothetical protein [Myxococcales bacterium]
MSLDLHRRKLTLGIILTTLAACAFFLARGTTALVASALLPLDLGAAPRETGQAMRPPGSETPDIKAILKRNIFDPVTGALWPPQRAVSEVDEGAALEGPVEELAEGQMPPPCEGSTKLIAAVYAENSPEWSFASLGANSGEALLYRQGGSVEGQEVVSIFPEAVFLRGSSGRLCSLTMFAAEENKGPAKAKTPVAAAKGPVAAAKAVPGAAVGGGAISAADLESGISKVSDTKYSVQRSLVDKVLENQAEIMRSARVVPHEQDGQVIGVKLYGIRRTSLLGKLGLQNGDTLRTINGYAMASPDTALEAYSKLRSASDLTIAVTRRGRVMNLEYQIQ